MYDPNDDHVEEQDTFVLTGGQKLCSEVNQSDTLVWFPMTICLLVVLLVVLASHLYTNKTNKAPAVVALLAPIYTLSLCV